MPTTLVALVDSGVDLASAADQPYYNFAAGYDAYDKQAVTPSTHALVQDTSLQHGHGSAVADFIVRGIADAKSQPGAGPLDVQIMPIRDTAPGALSPDDGALIRGVYWASDHGAAVINLSLRQYARDFYDTDATDPYYGFSLSRAIGYARSKGVAVVTAAGNETVNVDGSNPYGGYILPGSAASTAHNGLGVDLDNILVTAAVDPSNRLTPYSNWGPATVNIGAPTGTGSNAVTSYSTGYTSGVAGVIAALSPSATAGQRINLIEQSASPAPQPVGNWSTSGGVINPANAVARAIATVNLSGAFNAVGITADNATGPGNLDGSGHSLSAGLVGAVVNSGGVAFDLGPAGSADAIRAAGQTIALPSGNFGGLRLLGAAVNGTQAGSFTVNYADGSSATLARTFDDWHAAANAPGESLAVATAYRNAPGGRDGYFSNFSLFAYSLGLDPTRVVKSLTLPSNGNIAIFAANLVPSTSTATPVDLAGSFNVVGITADNNPTPGRLDGNDASYSAGLLGATVAADGVAFVLGPVGANDAVAAGGQTIKLPAGKFGSLSLLGTAVNGTQAGSFMVNYADGTHAAIAQSFDDWHAGANVPGESAAASMPFRNRAGGRDNQAFSLYSYALAVDPTRTVASLTLPNNPNIAVFALDLAP